MFDLLSHTQGRLGRLRSEMDQLFRSHFGELNPAGWLGNGHGWARYPAVNLWEDGENVYAEAEIPGLKIDDIDLSVVGDELILKGERKAPEVKEGAWHRRERRFGSFVRNIPLPVAIDADKVEASFKQGVLTVTLPKAEAVRPRKIEVKVIDKK